MDRGFIVAGGAAPMPAGAQAQVAYPWRVEPASYDCEGTWRYCSTTGPCRQCAAACMYYVPLTLLAIRAGVGCRMVPRADSLHMYVQMLGGVWC
jgi:hypothetical protein